MGVMRQPVHLGALPTVAPAPPLFQKESAPEVESSAHETLPLGEPLRLEMADCCICGHDDALPVGVGEDFEYRSSPDRFLAMQCRECGLVYLKLRPAVTELGRIYPPNYHAFDFSSKRFGLSYRVRRWLEARRLLPWCRVLPRGGRVLDVGCGDGFHLGLLREFGSRDWVVEGVDPSEGAVGVGQARGLTLHLGTVQDVSLPAESYDLVLLIQVIEHVDDPAAMLRAVHTLVRPGGRVLLVTDNTDTWSFRLFATRHWGGYHFPRHWNLFDGRNLRRLATGTGFEVEALSTIVSPLNWVYSIHNVLVDRGAPAWLVSRFTLTSPVSLAVFTVFDWVQQLIGRGALLQAVLRKPQAAAADPSGDNASQ